MSRIDYSLRRMILMITAITMSMMLFAQPNVKVGLENSAPNQLQVNLLPDADFDQVVSYATVTVRYLTTSGVSLGAPTIVGGMWPASLSVIDAGENTDGVFTYRTYTFDNSGVVYLSTAPGYGWTGGIERPFFTIPVTNTSGSCVEFALIDDAFQDGAANIQWYISLNGTPKDDGYIGGISSTSNGYPVWNTTSGEGFCTIQAAINDAQTLAGHTITVNAGTFTENVNISKGVTLTGSNSGATCAPRVAETLIAPASGTPFAVSADGVTIDGFEITNPAGGNAITASGRSALDIRSNYIHDIGTTTTTLNVHAILYTCSVNASDVVIADNCLVNIGNENLHQRSASAISAGFSTNNGELTDLVIERNSISNVNAKIVDFSSGGRGAYGVTINVGANPANTGKAINAIVRENDISDLEGLWAHAIGLEGETPGAQVLNNSIDNVIDHKSPSDAIGVMIEQNDGAGTVIISNNSFTNVEIALENRMTALAAPNANCNWFGSDQPADVSAAIRGPIDVSPFLIDGADGSAAIGFQPAGSCEGGFVQNISLMPIKSYATIQAAINDPLTLDGHTITVGAGVYVENVTVTKSLDIRGPNYGISPSATRVDEAIIHSATDDVDLAEIMTIAANVDNVSISGFLFDGDNPAFPSNGFGTNGADLHAAEGITVYSAGVDGLNVSHNIFQNLSYFGVSLFGGSYAEANTSKTGHSISDNLFQDMGTYDAASGIALWGGGVLLYNSHYASIMNNVMSNVRVGIQTGNFQTTHVGDPAYQVIDGNNIEARGLGVFFNLHRYSPWTVSNNTITGMASAGESAVPTRLWRGFLISSLGNNMGATMFSNNTIDGGDVTINPTYGYIVWNVHNNSPAHITGGTITNVGTGIYLNNYEGYNSNATDGAHATISGISIYASGIGIRVLDSPSSTTHANVIATIGSGVTVNGGAHGLSLENASASIGGASLNDIAFTGQTGNYVQLLANATDLDAISATFNSLTGATATLAQNFAIEDKISHATDNDVLGFVRVKALEVFVTQNSGSIQRGHDAADANDIVHASAGTFIEELVIDKAIDLRGANYGISPNTGSRGAETILMPSYSDPDATSLTGVSLMYLDGAISGYSVDGIMFNGDNPSLTSTLNYGGANIDVVEAFSAYDGVANTSIENNIFRNIGYGAVDLYNYTNSGAATTNNVVNDNLFENINHPSFGFAVLIYNNCYTAITNNVMDDVRIGIQTGNFHQADPGTSHEITNNTIESVRLGIFHNMGYSNATDFEVANNAITTVAGSPNNNGILISSFQGTVGVDLHDNTISGATNGYNLWNNPTSSTITVVGGSVNGCAVGVLANNYDGYNSNANTSTYVISGVNIQNSTVAGIHVKDNSANTNGSTVSVSMDGTTDISSSAVGLRLEGAGASASFTGAASFTGQSTYIQYATNSIDVPSTDIDATAVLFDGLTGTTATLAQNFAIEDKLTHKVDNNTFGLVRVKAGEIFATTASGGIQNAINAASSNDIVNVNSGTYAENVDVNVSVTLLGANANAACTPRVAESLIAPASGIPMALNADGVTINGFEMTAPSAGSAITASGRNALDIRSNNIHDIGTTTTTLHVHAIQYTCNVNASDVVIADNCLNNIGNENLHQRSASAITAGFSTNNGELTDLVIERNTITNVNAKIADFSSGGRGAYGITINVGANVANTGKAINAIVRENEISALEGLWAHAIGLEGETPGAQVLNNSIDDIIDHKTPSDAIGVMIEANDGVGTVTISNNSFTNVEIALENRMTALPEPNTDCNWYGTSDPATIAASVRGPITVTPFITNGTDDAADIGFQPVPGSCIGIWPVLNVNTSITYPTISEAVIAATAGDTLLLSDHIFTERVVLDKSLTIRGTSEANTILDGSSLSGPGRGISIDNAVTDVIIKDLTIRNYAGTGPNQYAGIYGLGMNDGLQVERVTIKDNVGGSGLYAGGPVNNVTLNDLDVSGHTAAFGAARGIVIWNGLKSNITITNCDVYNNNCCGIELQDGTASGVVMTGNNVHDNGDSGIGLVGLNGDVAANLIAGNTLANNGRFGIELKLPEGNGTDAGQGSLVVENNMVTFSATAGMNARDHAGIAVYRRGMLPGNTNGNADIPTGVVVRNNTVSGYAQLNPSAVSSEGFGIVIEGVDHVVSNNTLSNNEVGLQLQGGGHNLANYVENSGGDGSQDNGQSPNYFGRGNAPYICNITTSGNIFSSNTTDERVVTDQGVLSASAATNQKGKSVLLDEGSIITTYCSIQQAVNKSTGGGSITASASDFAENVIVNKSVSITGAGVGSTTVVPAITGISCGGGSICPGSSNVFLIQANNVSISDLTVDGDNTSLTSGTVVGGADIDARNGIITDHTTGSFTGTTVTSVEVKNIYLRGIYSSTGGSFNFTGNTVSNVKGEGGSIAMMNFGGSGTFANNTVDDCNDGIVSNQGSGAGSIYSGNTVTNCGSGIHTDNWNGPGTEQIFNNTVSSGTPNAYGIWAFASYAPVSIEENTVSDMTVGLMHAGTPGVNGVATFSANTVTNSNYGFYQTTSLFGFGNTNASSIFTNNILAGGDTAILLETHATRTRTLIANENSITGYDEGAALMLTDGSSNDDLTCNWWGVTYGGDVADLMTNVTAYDPWSVDGTDDSADPGFQPVAGSCSGITVGCMDPLALNYEPTASTSATCGYCEGTVTTNTPISTPIVIGSGIPADNASVGVRCDDMEIGLTAFNRFVGAIVPAGNVYTTATGNSPTSSSDATPAAGTARWNYLLSVNLGSFDFTEVTVYLDVDFDPSAAATFTTINVSDFMASQNLENTSVAQSSENFGFNFWTQAPFNLSFDPFAAGTYDLQARLVSPVTSEELMVVPIQVVVVPAIQLSADALLDGPYNDTDDLMGDNLRASLMPAAQPYNMAPWNYSGTETISNGVRNVTGNNAIVDWVLVELRDATDASIVVHSRAALIQRDGDIVDVDGINPITFINANAGNYHVALRHRNHLGAMTLAPIAINASPAAALDFTTVATYGTEAQKTRDGRNMLWAGNVTMDNRIRYAGNGNDRDPILAYMFAELGAPTVTSIVPNVYRTEDVNMNGTVKYAGSANDRDPILVNIGGNVATATRTEQLP